MSFYIRTGNGGTFPDYFIQDLGITVLSGSGWYQLQNLDGYTYTSGQFREEELRDSENLTSAIYDGYIEVSFDGVSAITDPSTYTPFSVFFENIRTSGGTIDLTEGGLVLPNVLDPEVSFPNPKPGQLAYDQNDGYLVVNNGSGWEQISTGQSLQLTVQAFNGIVNEPGQVVMTPDGIEIKALLPLIGDDVGWLFNDDGILLAIG
jgi:hypothetical protein